MVEVGSIGHTEIQIRKANEAASKPNEVRKAAKTPGASRIEPVTANGEKSSKSSGTSALTPGGFSRIVDETNENLKIINADLAIEVDTQLKQVIFKVVDLETGETIKQIPSEEMIRIAKKLDEIVEQYSENDTGGLQIFMDSGSFG